jgi:glycosyltransferase involved in cell wall biosynthesis
VHNVSTHEKQTLNDTLISRYLAFCSNALIVHSPDTIDQLKKIGIHHSNISIIPHGNYIGYYENSISKQGAQKKLNLSGKKLTFLYFGQIRSYKGVDTLIDTFEKVRTEHPDTQLIIAGQCNDSVLKDKIISFQKDNPESLYFFSNYIKDNEIQNYFNAADCVVIPFKRSTTSGSVLLALTFAKPIVYPGIGNMKEFPENIGFRYEANNNASFEKALSKAVKEKSKLSVYEKNAFEFTKQFNWDTIQKKTLDLYRSL